MTLKDKVKALCEERGIKEGGQTPPIIILSAGLL